MQVALIDSIAGLHMRQRQASKIELKASCAALNKRVAAQALGICPRAARFYDADRHRKVHFSSVRGLLIYVNLPMGLQRRGLWGHFNFTIAPLSRPYSKYRWFGGSRSHNRKVGNSRKGVRLESFLNISTLRLWPRLPPNHGIYCMDATTAQS